MANIWLVQYLCPQRHALCATPYERPSVVGLSLGEIQKLVGEIEGKLLAEMHRLGLQPWCGLCGSRELHFEHGKLAVDDWDEAWRLLKQGERANLATRALFGRRRSDRN